MKDLLMRETFSSFDFDWNDEIASRQGHARVPGLRVEADSGDLLNVRVRYEKIKRIMYLCNESKLQVSALSLIDQVKEHMIYNPGDRMLWRPRNGLSEHVVTGPTVEVTLPA
jgi:hypothetical protein